MDLNDHIIKDEAYREGVRETEQKFNKLIKEKRTKMLIYFIMKTGYYGGFICIEVSRKDQKEVDKPLNMVSLIK